MGMVPKYPRIFGNRFRSILVPKYSTTPGHSVCAGDGSQRSEEIEKNSRIAPLNAIILIIIISGTNLLWQVYMLPY